MPSSKEDFLSLIRLGIGHTASISIGVDWTAIEALATRQGLSAIVIDGIERLPEDKRPPKPMLLQWIGETLQGYEYRYELYCRAIAELAALYKGHGYKMMVLKGYACGTYWPRPEHRPYGDIDIWQFGQQKDADAVIAREKGIKIDESHHHHTIFLWRDFSVENHFDFVNVHAEKSSRSLESIFKQLGEDDSYTTVLMGESVYLPSPNLHALFLLRHMVSHFTSTELSLRQILDWAFFIKANTREIDWEWLTGLLGEYHMIDFYNCINAICVDDLGFDVRLFPSVQFMPELKERILNDTLFPEFDEEQPHGLIPRAVYRFRRWRANGWKQELCYEESRCSAFWSGVWAHLIKPASI